MIDDVGLEGVQGGVQSGTVAHIADARLQPTGCRSEAGPRQQAEVVQRGLRDIQGEDLSGAARKGLKDEFGADGAGPAGDHDPGAVQLRRDGGGIEFNHRSPEQIVDAHIAQLAGTQFPLNPALGGRDVHHAQTQVQCGIDDRGFALRRQVLNGDDEALRSGIGQDPFDVVRGVDGGTVNPLALLHRVVVQEGHHLEGVGTRALHGLLGDDARFAGSKNDHGRGARRLEPLVNRAHGDAESDQEDGRSEELNGHHAQGNGIGAAHAVGGEVLREEQSGTGRQREQDPTRIPGAAEPDDAGIGAEHQHAQCPD